MGAKCKSFGLGGGVMKCVEEQPKCVPSNGECGGPGRETVPCCGDATCMSSVTGVMKCLEVHKLAVELNSELQCVPSNGECGGPGRQTVPCCGSAKCKSFGLGGGVMKCVEEQPEQQCACQRRVRRSRPSNRDLLRRSVQHSALSAALPGKPCHEVCCRVVCCPTCLRSLGFPAREISPCFFCTGRHRREATQVCIGVSCVPWTRRFIV